MNVYTYDPAQWGAGGIRLEGPLVTAVDDPKRADVFVVPQTLAFMRARGDDTGNAARFLELPHLEGKEARHVVVDIAEHCPPPPVPGVLYFRCGDVSDRMVLEYPSTIPWPWPVDDLRDAIAERASLPFRWDVGYVGYNTPLDLTPRAIASCEEQAGLTTQFERHVDAWGWGRDHGSQEPSYRRETERRRLKFLDVLAGARVTLEPVAKQGTWRYRFFESWSASRIPVHIGDGCARPWGHKIPYDELAIWVPEEDVAQTGDIVRAWLDHRTDIDLLALGRLARRFYERYLHRDRWPELMAEAVAEVIA